MQTVKLQSKNREYTAEILPSRGASCISLCHTPTGMEILRTPKSEETYITDNAFLYGTPPLLFPNRITGGRFVFRGREYRLPVNEPQTGCFIHGTLHETHMQMLECGGDYAVFAYRATKEAPYLGCFSHEFFLTLRYDLTASGMKQTMTVKNESDSEMPMGLAYHTTFRLPFMPGGDIFDVRLTLPVGEEFARDMRDYSMTWNLVDDKAFADRLAKGEICPAENIISRHFRRPRGAEMRLTDEKSGHGIFYRGDDKFKFWMLYNGDNKDLICLEPQTWMNNGVNAPEKMGDTGVIGIPAGEAMTFVTEMGAF